MVKVLKFGGSSLADAEHFKKAAQIIKEEKEYFNSVLEKLKSEHKQIVADKQEIDLQLGAGIRTGRRKEDFEKKEERAEE